MSKSVSGKSTNSSDTKYFRKMLVDLVKAWETQNPAKAASFYSKKSGLTFFDFAPLKYTGWKEYAKGVQKLFFDNMPPKSSGIKLSDDFQVKRFGNGAVTTSTFHFWAKMKDGTKIENDGRVTMVWEKTGRNWQVVHDHWSFPFSPK
jgi:ketosteroid isomerase-like protein